MFKRVQKQIRRKEKEEEDEKRSGEAEMEVSGSEEDVSELEGSSADLEGSEQESDSDEESHVTPAAKRKRSTDSDEDDESDSDSDTDSEADEDEDEDEDEIDEDDGASSSSSESEGGQWKFPWFIARDLPFYYPPQPGTSRDKGCEPVQLVDCIVMDEEESSQVGASADVEPSRVEWRMTTEEEADEDEKHLNVACCLYCPGKVLKNDHMLKLHAESKPHARARRRYLNAIESLREQGAPLREPEADADEAQEDDEDATNEDHATDEEEEEEKEVVPDAFDIVGWAEERREQQEEEQRLAKKARKAESSKTKAEAAFKSDGKPVAAGKQRAWKDRKREIKEAKRLRREQRARADVSNGDKTEGSKEKAARTIGSTEPSNKAAGGGQTKMNRTARRIQELSAEVANLDSKALDQTKGLHGDAKVKALLAAKKRLAASQCS